MGCRHAWCTCIVCHLTASRTSVRPAHVRGRAARRRRVAVFVLKGTMEQTAPALTNVFLSIARMRLTAFRRNFPRSRVKPSHIVRLQAV